MKKIFRETVLVSCVGLLFGLGANLLSPKGISLTRNYFHLASAKTAPPAGPENAQAKAAPSTPQTLAERLAEKGLQLAEFDQVSAWFEDPRHLQGLIVFLDARDEKKFLEGHIPRAVLFDHYRMEQYISTVLPLCQVAEKIVVYCNGGECEDSEFAALDLKQFGIPTEKIHIYGGGFQEWKERQLPVEQGPSSKLPNP